MRFHQNLQFAAIAICLVIGHTLAGAGGQPPPAPEATTNESSLDEARKLMAQAKYAEAEKKYEEIVLLDGQSLGPQNARTLADRLELAVAQGKAGNSLTAENEMCALLAIFVRRDGPDHDEVLQCRTALAHLLSDVGRTQEAVKECRQILDGRERMLGPDDIEVARVRRLLGDTLAVSGEYREAIGLFRQAGLIFAHVLGPEQPETLVNRSNLALAEAQIQEFDAAEKELKEVLVIRERLLGPNETSVLMTCFYLARILGGHGRYDEALIQATRAAEGLRSTLDPSNKILRDADGLRREIQLDLARTKAGHTAN